MVSRKGKRQSHITLSLPLLLRSLPQKVPGCLTYSRIWYLSRGKPNILWPKSGKGKGARFQRFKVSGSKSGDSPPGACLEPLDFKTLKPRNLALFRQWLECDLLARRGLWAGRGRPALHRLGRRFELLGLGDKTGWLRETRRCLRRELAW